MMEIFHFSLQKELFQESFSVGRLSPQASSIYCCVSLSRLAENVLPDLKDKLIHPRRYLCASCWVKAIGQQAQSESHTTARTAVGLKVLFCEQRSGSSVVKLLALRNTRSMTAQRTSQIIATASCPPEGRVFYINYHELQV